MYRYTLLAFVRQVRAHAFQVERTLQEWAIRISPDSWVNLSNLPASQEQLS